MLVACQVLSQVGQVGNMLMECLQLGVLDVSCLLLTLGQVIRVLDMFEKVEVGDGRTVSRQELSIIV